MSTVSPAAPQDEPPTGWGVLLAILADWGIVLRLMALALLPIAGFVVIVTVVAIYLGPVGVGALLTTTGGVYGTKRYLARRRRRRGKDRK